MSTPFQSLNIFLEIMLPSKYEFNEKTFKETFSQQQNDFPKSLKFHLLKSNGRLVEIFSIFPLQKTFLKYLEQVFRNFKPSNIFRCNICNKCAVAASRGRKRLQKDSQPFLSKRKKK